jgi:hypothetical protein
VEDFEGPYEANKVLRTALADYLKLRASEAK